MACAASTGAGPETPHHDVPADRPVPHSQPGPDAQPVHGTIFLMVDGHGMVRGVYMLEDPELIPKMLLDAGNLLREQGQG